MSAPTSRLPGQWSILPTAQQLYLDVTVYYPRLIWGHFHIHSKVAQSGISFSHNDRGFAQTGTKPHGTGLHKYIKTSIQQTQESKISSYTTENVEADGGTVLVVLEDDLHWKLDGHRVLIH